MQPHAMPVLLVAVHHQVWSLALLASGELGLLKARHHVLPARVIKSVLMSLVVLLVKTWDAKDAVMVQWPWVVFVYSAVLVMRGLRVLALCAHQVVTAMRLVRRYVHNAQLVHGLRPMQRFGVIHVHLVPMHHVQDLARSLVNHHPMCVSFACRLHPHQRFGFRCCE